MTSIPTPPPHNLAFSTAAAAAASRLTPTKRPYYAHPPSRSPDPASLCRCSAGGNSSSSSSSSSSDDTSPFNRRWDSAIQDVLKSAIKRFDSVLSSYRTQDKDGGNDAVTKKKKKVEGDEDEWDWERWKKHFKQVDEQERLLSVLKVL